MLASLANASHANQITEPLLYAALRRLGNCVNEQKLLSQLRNIYYNSFDAKTRAKVWFEFFDQDASVAIPTNHEHGAFHRQLAEV